MPTTWEARPPASRPVPWVPVCTAPETVCTAMSPMLARALPCPARTSLKSHRGVPAATVAVPASESRERRPVRAVGDRSRPSVIATSVKE